MNISEATVDYIANLAGISIEEAKYLLASLFESGYSDTTEAMESGVWDQMVSAARREAGLFSGDEPPSDD